MTNEEALKSFRFKYEMARNYNDPHWECGEEREHHEYIEQLACAINALVREIPTPQHFHVNRHGVMICTRTGKDVRYPIVSILDLEFCPRCGQALDWRL